ncbi:MAG: hypothetical protein ACI9N9_000071 [Enterobacterales bacterium]|jgi:hypothetical protein
MITDIAKSTINTAVSFDNKSHLTKAQVALMKLLNDSVKNKSTIDKDVMIDFYINNIKQRETFKERGRYTYYYDEFNIQKWGWVQYINPITKRWRDVYDIDASARNWFKNNLGAVILKGKVLIVPVFE